MNDKDSEAFNVYMDEHKSIYFGMPDWAKDTDRAIWLDACEYKQKEIDIIKAHAQELFESREKLWEENSRLKESHEL